MPFIEVKQGGPDIPVGVYPVTLVSISDPKTVDVQRGPKAGTTMELLDWSFAIDEGKYESTEIRVSSSMSSGPKSKIYAFLTALYGGQPPAIGASFEKDQLYGRRALATVSKDENGYLRIDNLGAMPASMLGARVAKATGAPTNEPVPSASPLRDTVAESPGLPF